MPDFVIAYTHPHRTDAVWFAVLIDPAPGWAKREPYRGRDMKAVPLRGDEPQTLALAEIRAMHEAAPEKTLEQLIDGWRWDRELYWRRPRHETEQQQSATGV